MHPPNFYGFGRSPPATQSASTANLTAKIENVKDIYRICVALRATNF
jgi:hypothetical protein